MKIKSSDNIKKYYKDYIHTENLAGIWSIKNPQLKLINKKEKIVNLVFQTAL